jgi:hypothetical protein
VREEADCLVVGGGSAGCVAALTAARLGLRTTLLEEMPFLGGMSTGGAVGTYCGFYLRERDGRMAPLLGGVPLEIAQTLLDRGHAYGPVPFKETAALPYVPWGVKLLLEELVARQPRLHLRLHAKLGHVVTEGGEIQGVVAHGPSGAVALRARVYVDASGDAVLSRLAGAPTRVGDAIQYPSMMFTMQNVSLERAGPHLGRLREIIEAHLAQEKLPRRGGNLIPTGRPGEVLVALSRVSLAERPLDGSNDEELTFGELEGRRQAERLGDFLRRCVPGFEQAFLADAAPRLGLRETRRIEGEYALREDDVLGLRRFEDGIGRSAWPIERHVAGGETLWTFLAPGTFYTIPFRCLVPRDVSNLLAVGRCVSADAGAFASVRVIGPCMLEGQAAGAAAEILCQRGGPARELDVDRLRHQLTLLGGLL